MKFSKITDFYIKNRIRIFEILILILVILIFTGGKNKYYPEKKYLSENKFESFKELERYFVEVAEKKGASYAFGLLGEATLPPNTDTHLLGHAVGNVLYKKEGAKGIKKCSDDFRNACSHSVVVGLFVEKGTDALAEISSACKEAPGGRGAYGMCFHGLGHGILAYANYDLRKGIELCRKVGTAEFGYIESAECIGGEIMEMVSGVHDRDAWLAATKIYFKEDDALYPCTDGMIPSNARNLCFSYLTPHIMESAGITDASQANDIQLSEAFGQCGRLKGDYEEFRKSCYAGFGKEFVVLANARDIRNIEDIGEESLKKVVHWCSLAGDEEGTTVCYLEAINSLYWGGENDIKAPVSFCNMIPDSHNKNACFDHLIGAVKYYSTGITLRKSCSKLPEEYVQRCNVR